MQVEDCKSLHPGSIPGQASTVSLGERPSEDLATVNETEPNGGVRDHESRPNPEPCSSDVLRSQATWRFNGLRLRRCPIWISWRFPWLWLYLGRDLMRERGHVLHLSLFPKPDLMRRSEEGMIILAGWSMSIYVRSWSLWVATRSDVAEITERMAARAQVPALPIPA